MCCHVFNLKYKCSKSDLFKELARQNPTAISPTVYIPVGRSATCRQNVHELVHYYSTAEDLPLRTSTPPWKRIGASEITAPCSQSRSTEWHSSTTIRKGVKVGSVHGRYSFSHFWSRCQMEVCIKQHTPAALPHGSKPGIHSIGEWARPRNGRRFTAKKRNPTFRWPCIVINSYNKTN